MDEIRYDLSQFNIARALAPLSDQVIAGFVSQLDAINAVAEQSPGFVWRLKAEDGSSSTYVRAFEDERILINMSVSSTIVELIFASRNQPRRAPPAYETTTYS